MKIKPSCKFKQMNVENKKFDLCCNACGGNNAWLNNRDIT